MKDITNLEIACYIYVHIHTYIYTYIPYSLFIHSSIHFYLNFFLGDSIQYFDISGNKLSDFSNFVEVFSKYKELKEVCLKGNCLRKRSLLRKNATTGDGVYNDRDDNAAEIDNDENYVAVMSENSLRKNVVRALLPTCTMLQQVDGYSTSQIIEKFNDAALKKELKLTMFNTWDDNDERGADVLQDFTEEDDVYIDSSDSDNDGPGATNKG